ncbi:hypothetical protein KSP40_PGU016734 [Platanthera guangdongensis]|uniref:Replication protein A C-terminal domain-containing protein n=1 Tax=Platanthera guangdongensis TaxID=2320717 RepID=A0ABR2LQS3_9ASPA
MKFLSISSTAFKFMQPHSGKKVGGSAQFPGNSFNSDTVASRVRENNSPASSQSPGAGSKNNNTETDIYKLVLDVFEEPVSLASEHGLHVDEIVRKLGIPHKKIKEAIEYHVDVGHIYSTIDDYHFKSACTS